MEVAGKVPDQVAEGEGHEQAANPLANQEIRTGGGGSRGGEEASRLDRLTGELARQVRGSRRRIAVGRDLVL
jgi:hypothetical protein